MARCSRCCLRKTIRIVNVMANLFAIGVIVYALWLQKKWSEGTAELATTAYLPKPWFIYTCLGAGIVVCLSTLFGHRIADCISSSALFILIVTICSLVLLEVAVVVVIFFTMDWQALIAEYIDEHHRKFKIFIMFHLKMCQIISILILVPQINVIVLAVSLLVIGIKPRSQRSDSEINQSFLVGPNEPMPDESRHTCCNCGNLPEENSHENFWSYIKGLPRMLYQRTTVN